MGLTPFSCRIGSELPTHSGPPVQLFTQTPTPLLFWVLTLHWQRVRGSDFCRSPLRCLGPAGTLPLGEGSDSPIEVLLPPRGCGCPVPTSGHSPHFRNTSEMFNATEKSDTCRKLQRPPVSLEACASPGSEPSADILFSSVLRAWDSLRPRTNKRKWERVGGGWVSSGHSSCFGIVTHAADPADPGPRVV